MKEILIKNKQEYLAEHYPFENPPALTEERRCLHCGSIFKVEDYKVFKDVDNDEFICCPNAPDCDGTIIDWMDTI